MLSTSHEQNTHFRGAIATRKASNEAINQVSNQKIISIDKYLDVMYGYAAMIVEAKVKYKLGNHCLLMLISYYHQDKPITVYTLDKQIRKSPRISWFGVYLSLKTLVKAGYLSKNGSKKIRSFGIDGAKYHITMEGKRVAEDLLTFCENHINTSI